jgi:hypothetical protein
MNRNTVVAEAVPSKYLVCVEEGRWKMAQLCSSMEIDEVKLAGSNWRAVGFWRPWSGPGAQIGNAHTEWYIRRYSVVHSVDRR